MNVSCLKKPNQTKLKKKMRKISPFYHHGNKDERTTMVSRRCCAGHHDYLPWIPPSWILRSRCQWTRGSPAPRPCSQADPWMCESGTACSCSADPAPYLCLMGTPVIDERLFWAPARCPMHCPHFSWLECNFAWSFAGHCVHETVWHPSWGVPSTTCPACVSACLNCQCCSRSGVCQHPWSLDWKAVAAGCRWRPLAEEPCSFLRTLAGELCILLRTLGPPALSPGRWVCWHGPPARVCLPQKWGAHTQTGSGLFCLQS